MSIFDQSAPLRQNFNRNENFLKLGFGSADKTNSRFWQTYEDHEFNGADAASAASRTQDTQKTGRTGASQSGAANGAQSGDHVEFSSGLGQLSRAISPTEQIAHAKCSPWWRFTRVGTTTPIRAATSRSMISDALDGSVAA